MDTFKGRRVLHAVARVVALDAPRREFQDKPHHERMADARSERAMTEQQDKLLVEAFLAKGGSVHVVKPTAKMVRREQRVIYTKLTPEGKREMVVATIPAINQPVFTKKGGVCAGYVYDL